MVRNHKFKTLFVYDLRNTLFIFNFYDFIKLFYISI